MTEEDKKRAEALIAQSKHNAAVYREIAVEASVQAAAMAELHARFDDAEKMLIEGDPADREKAEAFLAQCDLFSNCIREGTPESHEKAKVFLDQLAEANGKREI